MTSRISRCNGTYTGSCCCDFAEELLFELCSVPSLHRSTLNGIAPEFPCRSFYTSLWVFIKFDPERKGATRVRSIAHNGTPATHDTGVYRQRYQRRKLLPTHFCHRIEWLYNLFDLSTRRQSAPILSFSAPIAQCCKLVLLYYHRDDHLPHQQPKPQQQYCSRHRYSQQRPCQEEECEALVGRCGCNVCSDCTLPRGVTSSVLTLGGYMGPSKTGTHAHIDIEMPHRRSQHNSLYPALSNTLLYCINKFLTLRFSPLHLNDTVASNTYAPFASCARREHILFSNVLD